MFLDITLKIIPYLPPQWHASNKNCYSQSFQEEQTKVKSASQTHQTLHSEAHICHSKQTENESEKTKIAKNLT